MGRDGVAVPRPDALPRGAVVGSVEVTDFVRASNSRGFGGPVGLTLAEPVACDPVPCPGARGYFARTPGGTLAPPATSMRNRGPAEGGLFDDLPPDWAAPPEKPFGRSRDPARRR